MQKVIFMGTPDYAHAILQEMIKSENIDVVAVFTQPDKPFGRKKILTPPPVKVLAQENDINVLQPISMKDEESISEVLKIECDFIIVAAYGQILPKEILEHAPSINLHASILPAYRGASPIQQSLLNNDKRTGITAMMMEEGLDCGGILKISTIDIAPNELVESLFDRLSVEAAKLTLHVIDNFKALHVEPQDSTSATYCKKITKAHGEVEFNDAQEIYNKYRAFTPWPAIYLKSGLKILEIESISTDKNYEMGKIIEINRDSVRVGCKSGSVVISKVQAPSKKAVSVIDYINGKRLNIADYLS
ncbi:MAG: methionyl-tRNA formyltransferase [Campylobacterota bacterium]|nr:methionyl-tRNA formyltransferase [Campylobacterota bacterium]